MGESLPDPRRCAAWSRSGGYRPVTADRPGRQQRSEREDETMDHFVGIDVSLESCAVCVVNQSGAVLREAKVFF